MEGTALSDQDRQSSGMMSSKVGEDQAAGYTMLEVGCTMREVEE